MATDQAQEQMNMVLQAGAGNLADMYDKPDALAFNMLSALDVARVVTTFESVYENNTAKTTEFHEQRPALQLKFLSDAMALTIVSSDKGNPFKEKCPSLIVLDTREVVEVDVTRSLLSLKQHGTKQLN